MKNIKKIWRIFLEGMENIEAQRMFLKDRDRIRRDNFDNLIYTVHNPSAISKIEGKVRELLQEIENIIEPKFNSPSFEEIKKAKEAPDHRDFKFAIMDTTTISFALQNKEGRFYMPLNGGIDFLRHILVCEYCQLFISDFSDEICVGSIDLSEDVKWFKQEFMKSGAKLKDSESATSGEFDLPEN